MAAASTPSSPPPPPAPRFPGLRADVVAGYLSAPDTMVAEVLSEGTQAKDRGKKRRIYRREGVGHDGLLDPRDRTLEVYRLVDGKWLEVDTHEGDAVVRAEPFDAIELDLALLWKL
jgi:Uma2 family endonuclease